MANKLSEPRYTIWLTAGHGGSDPGAVYPDLPPGLQNEKDLNLKVTKYIKEIIAKDPKLKDRLTVIEARKDDKDLSLEENIDAANNWHDPTGKDPDGVDAFVSVHHNASENNQNGIPGDDVSGYAVYHTMHGGPGQRLAESIARRYEKDLGHSPLGGQGVRSWQSEITGKDYLYEIRETNMPAVLSEFGFPDTAQDASLVNTEQKLYKQAAAIVHGIADWLKLDSSSVSGSTSRATTKKNPSAAENLPQVPLIALSKKDAAERVRQIISREFALENVLVTEKHGLYVVSIGNTAPKGSPLSLGIFSSNETAKRAIDRMISLTGLSRSAFSLAENKGKGTFRVSLSQNPVRPTIDTETPSNSQFPQTYLAKV